MPYRDSPDPDIIIVMSFNYLNSLKPNEHNNSGPNDKKLLFEIEDQK